MTNEHSNNGEASDAEIIAMLGSYGDAIERSVTPDGDPGAPTVETANRQDRGGTRSEGQTMSEFDEETPEVRISDITVNPDPVKESSRGRVLVGALAVTAVAVIGGAFALSTLSDDDDNTDTAAVVGETEDSAEEDGAEEAMETNDAPVEEGAEDDAAVAQESAAAESGSAVSSTQPAFDVGFSGPGSVVFADGEFVSIGGGPDGVSVSRSADGLNWTSEPVSGLPEGAFPMGLAQTSEGWATVVEVFPEFEEGDPELFFGPGPDAERFIATSTDLVNWTTTEFPDVDVEDGGFAFVNGLAASGDTIAALVQAEPGGIDEMQILFEAGVITEADLENLCGTEFEDGGPFVGYSCDFDENGIDTQDGETELFRVEPGDPVYDEIAAIYSRDGFEFESLAPVVVSGPLGGPFEVNKLPATGFAMTIAGSDSGFVTTVSNFESGENAVLTSVDGVTWSESGSTGADGSIDSAAISNDRVVTIGQSFTNPGGPVEVLVSADGGVTFTESPIPTELFGPFGQVIDGPAGFVISLNGTTEPFDDFNPFPEDLVIELVSDGYTMVFPLNPGDIELLGPDGVSVHGPISQDVFIDDGIEGVIRFDGPFQETLIWLDPATGEDLVSFTEDDFNEAFDEVAPAFDDSDFVEPDRATELWLSVDGDFWELIHSFESDFSGDSFTTLAGVGDDEVLIRTESFGQPPEELFAFEEEGRGPTAAEEAALDEWFLNQEDSVVWEAIPIG